MTRGLHDGSPSGKTTLRRWGCAIPLPQPARKLGPGLHVELAERLAEVVLDGARADEQLSGDLAVGVPLRREAWDLKLPRGQLVDRLRGPLAGMLAGRLQLDPSALGERLHAE